MKGTEKESLKSDVKKSAKEKRSGLVADSRPPPVLPERQGSKPLKVSHKGQSKSTCVSNTAGDTKSVGKPAKKGVPKADFKTRKNNVNEKKEVKSSIDLATKHFPHQDGDLTQDPVLPGALDEADHDTLCEELEEVVIKGPELEDSSVSQISDEPTQEDSDKMTEFDVWEKTHRDLAARAEEVVNKMLGVSDPTNKPILNSGCHKGPSKPLCTQQSSGAKGKRSVSFKDTLAHSENPTSPVKVDVGDGNSLPTSTSPDKKVHGYTPA